jgi:hypothetical protein
LGISLRRLGKSLRDGTAVRRFWSALTLENSFPAVAFNGTQFALPAYGPDLCSATTTTTVTTVAGKLYELSATGSGSITIAVGTAASGTNILTAATYATARYFTAVGTTTHLTVAVTSGSLTDILVREVMLGEMGANLGASGYTMTAGAGTATESPTGTLTLASGGTADLSIGSLTVGAHYRVVCLVATNAATVQVGTSSGGTQTVPATSLATGVGAIEFTATATTHHLRFTRASAGNTVVSSITVAQWTPRPTLRTATFGEVFAFTASSTTARSYVGSDGLIKNDLSADVPRVDYSNGRARYLFENQSTNLAIRASEFDDATWTKSGATVTANAGVAPDGTSTADRIQGTSGARALLQTITISPAVVYTVSVYARSFDGNAQPFQLFGDGTFVSGDLSVSGTSWQRFTHTFTSTGTGGRTFGIIDNVASANYDILFWGFQVEAQAFASSYIPTTAATVTRLIETPRFSPLVEAISNLPGATLRVQGTARTAKVNQRILGAASTAPLLRADSSTASTIGTGTGSLTATSVLPGPFGVVNAINSSGQSLSANGGAATSSTTAANARTQLYLARGQTVDASNPYGDGYYNGFALWPFRAAAASLPSVATAPS